MKQASNLKRPFANVYTIALVAMLTALSVAGRLLFASIPNVQPSTTIVIVVTLLFGWRYGVVHAVFMLFLSNLFLGMGIWFIPQVIAFSTITTATALIRPFYQKLPIVVMAGFAGLCGFLFGLIDALLKWPMFGFHYFWAYYMASIPFDASHAVGNFVFYIVLAPTLIPILQKLLAKYQFLRPNGQ